MQPATNIRAILISAVCALLFSGSAFAQQNAGQGRSAYGQQGSKQYQQSQRYRPAPPERPQKVSESQLREFAAARIQVLKIRKQYTAKLQHVKDQGKARKLQHAATRKMVKAVQRAGLDVKTYNNIAMQIRQNPALQKRLSKIHG